MRIKIRQLISILVTTFIAVTYNACGAGFQNQKEAIQSLDLASNTSVDPEAFAKFQGLIKAHCITCHGSPTSAFPGIANFAIITTEAAWIADNRRFVVPGNYKASAIYNRLSFAAGETPETRNNMPFPNPGAMTKADADFIKNYITNLKSSIAEPGKSPQDGFGALTKVKLLVTGEAITNQEIGNIILPGNNGQPAKINKAALKTAILTWIDTPNGQKRLQDFLRMSLQQDGYIYESNRLVGSMIGDNKEAARKLRDQFVSNIKESFAKTAIDIVMRNRPFTEVVTTRRHAVTTGLLSTLAFIDNSRITEGFENANFISDANTNLNTMMRDNMTDADFNDWRFVTLSQAADNESPIRYDNVAALRSIPNGGSMALAIPRVGFFNTISYQLKWPTNDGNKFRLTMNQALITALGETFEAGDQTPHTDLSALDSLHAKPGTSCYQCHRLMDPMRETFKLNFNTFYRYSSGTEAKTPAFNFKGHQKTVNSMDSLAYAIATHPAFPLGWTLRLCSFANSKKCDANDPEIIKIANNFRNSGFNFKNLMAEMYSSDLVVGEIKSIFGEQPLISINRENHFCSVIDTRYRQVLTNKGLPYVLSKPSICEYNESIQSLPEDSMARGKVDLVQSIQTNPFISRARDIFCERLTDKMLKEDNAFNFATPAEIEDSLNYMVTDIMGLPLTHPRHQRARDAIKSVYDFARNNKSDPEDAGRQAFVFACQSPELAGMGL